MEERKRLMGECEASGKSRKEFAQERGLNCMRPINDLLDSDVDGIGSSSLSPS